MKILLAINSTNAETIVDNSLRWCARLGLELRLFVPKDAYSYYVNAINDTNYHWYVDVKHRQIIRSQTAIEYAEENGFDLLLTIPEDLHTWRKGLAMKPQEIYVARIAIGKARLEFGAKPRMKIKRWANGVTMERVGYVDN